MSQAGFTFELGSSNQTYPSVDVRDGDLNTPESLKAMELLQSQLHIKIPGTNSTEIFDIEVVEAYPELDAKYEKHFNEQPRDPNSLFIVPSRAFLVNVVANPDTKAVVYLREVSATGETSKSLSTHLKRIFEKEGVMELDGVNLKDPNSPITLEPKKHEQQLAQVIVSARGSVQASDTRGKVRQAVLPPIVS